MLRKKLYFCNAFFEWELDKKKSVTIEEGLRAHPLFFQLHYLPLLFADHVLLAKAPPRNFPTQAKIHLLSDQNFSDFELTSYAPTHSLQQWAKEKKIPYQIPPLDLVEEITSKVFSFENTQQLPGSKILHSLDETKAWLAVGKFPKVLKTPFGFSGTGHTILRHADANISKLQFPLIGEPWVERTLDFSTHYEVGESITCVGKTTMQNSARGSFLSCTTDADTPQVDHLPLLQKIQKRGFFGPISIDSFVYEEGIHPVVEINPRHTMSSIAVLIAKKLGYPIKLTYGSHGNLLPAGYRKNLSIVRV
ncbi:MAG: hypothetical protein SNF33_04485 [Candidatus Algichlamydia australiensis]|nr:hypothetical protein [Chlamydiales bacterium]